MYNRINTNIHRLTHRAHTQKKSEKNSLEFINLYAKLAPFVKPFQKKNSFGFIALDVVYNICTYVHV